MNEKAKEERWIMHEGHRERIRERLFSHGESLTDHELLEILLFDPINRRNTNPIAHDLLDSFGDLEGVFNATPRLLCTVAGIGPRAAEHIWMVGELMRRIRGVKNRRISLSNFGEVSAFIRERFDDCKTEKLEVYLADVNCVFLCAKTVSGVRKDKVSLGSQTFGYILSEVKPVNVIVAHNHPSGNSTPSEEDDRCMREISRMCHMHGARLCDSVIVGKDLYSYYYTGRIYSVEYKE